VGTRTWRSVAKSRGPREAVPRCSRADTSSVVNGIPDRITRRRTGLAVVGCRVSPLLVVQSKLPGLSVHDLASAALVQFEQTKG